MKATTDRAGKSPPRSSLSQQVSLFSLGLIALAILSIFVIPPDATRVLGFSSGAPSSNPAGGCSYRVLPGDNLFRIGLRYGVPFQYLAALNGILDPNIIFGGTVLSVPCGPGAQSNAPVQPNAPGQSCGPGQTYVVNPGDNLFRIALNHGSTVDLLRSANNLYGRVLHPGMTLTVPCAGSAADVPAPSTPSNQVIVVTPAPTTGGGPGAPVVTPQVTLAAPGAVVTPAVTIVPVQNGNPISSTPVSPVLVPQAVITPAPAAANMVISMKGNQFVKETIQIRVGGRVTWVNNETDGALHTVTCSECPSNFTFDSGSNPIGPGKSFSVLFNVPGVYFYRSNLQPNMTGMIIVNP